MNKDELLSIIRKESTSNRPMDSIHIAKKYKIPLNIVELMRRRISKEQK
ncbi:hypothetical protein [Paenibacillus alvei]|uniref:Uncharacterized protein n=1 Tax=Paenibacillus alvei TaxID=44250 RepID=A0AAP7DHR6_PAEAL|nr:hypothetical protein [Paenibacillus alvei]MCY9578774.1 hypothetical protein [Paenibacillus alvei]MCY9583830.1 hypothetical protein [Paenibacillus alvei]NEZ41560.1 hypothetical protein [Paenibacillus alvei]NOJ69879.1 hypothetical protein [Paenibacillus alvei]